MAAESRRRPPAGAPGSIEDIALERALEGLFRLGANRRFDSQQAEAIGATVTRAGYAVLRSLSDHGTLTLRDVAEAAAMDAATASRQVGSLVDEGLVSRRTAADDARSIDLELTARGRDVYERIVRYRLAHLANVLEGWPDRDRATLARLVDSLVERLGATPAPRTAL